MKALKSNLLILPFLLFAAKPVLAQSELTRSFVSTSGKTTVQIKQARNWEEAGAIIGTYKQSDGSGGYLTNTGRDDPMGFYTKFYDTSGNDRCVGRMHLYIDDSGSNFASKTTWVIDGSVSGYQCSTVGKTFELEMQQR